MKEAFNMRVSDVRVEFSRTQWERIRAAIQVKHLNTTQHNTTHDPTSAAPLAAFSKLKCVL